MSSTGRGRPVEGTRGVGSGFAEFAGGMGADRGGALADGAARAVSEAAGSGGALAEGAGAMKDSTTDATAEGDVTGTDAVDAATGSSALWAA